MSLATICRRLASLAGVQPASVWIGNPDVTASEIVAWVQEAQSAVSTAYDWSTLATNFVTSLSSGSNLSRSVSLPDDLARIIPDSVTLDNRKLWGPLTAAEWDQIAIGAGSARPAFSLLTGKLWLTGAGSGGALCVGYVAAVPDYANDSDETYLGRDQPELVRMFETVILYSALAAYRDSKGLPAGTAAAQAMAALADARTRDQPVGALTLARRHRHHHGGLIVTMPGGGDLTHALLDDLAPDDDPLSDDLAA